MYKSGFLSYYLIFLIFLSVNACAQNHEIKNDKELKYLALGDSYTIGESVDSLLDWPIQLTDSLKAIGYHFNDTRIIARTGWTTAELKQGINDAEPESDYDLVSLLIGVNNQYRGYDIEIYKKEFKELLETAIELAGDRNDRVFVVSIPNYGVTPFGQNRDSEKIRRELLIYDSIADSIASEMEIPFVNITPISERAIEQPTLIAEDALHPSGEMYTLWVEEMLPIVSSLLNEQ